MAAPPTSTKQAIGDAYASAQAEQAPNEAPADPTQQQGGDPVAALQTQVTHLTNLLLQKGIISPHDLTLLPQMPMPGAPMAPPGAPPMQ